MEHITKRMDYEKITHQLYDIDSELWDVLLGGNVYSFDTSIIELVADYINNYSVKLRDEAWGI